MVILSSLLGIFGSILPKIIGIYERKLEVKYEIELLKVKLDAAKEQTKLQLLVEDAKSNVAEAQSLRSYDNNTDGGKLINALRASVRPVITYTFFILFLVVKGSAAYVMIKNGASIPTMLNAIWDSETMALFSTIMTFWFGSRIYEKTYDRIENENKNNVKNNTKSTK